MKVSASFKSEFKILKEIAYDMNILLVEDDEILQEQITRFLSRFFNKICVANHETAAMMKYERNQYDIIISDLNACQLHCIDLAKEIKKINPFQNILVFSNDTQSEKLVELINIGIDGFLPKPLEANLLVSQLNTICHKIYEHKIMELFSEILEEENKKLEADKMELEQIIDHMIVTNNPVEKPTKEPIVEPILEPKTPTITCQASNRIFTQDEEALLYTRREKMSAEEFFNVYPFELDKTNENLEDIENKFYILLSKSKQNIDHETLLTLTSILKSFAKEIDIIPHFVQLAYGINELGKTFDSLEDYSQLPNVMPMVASLFDNLESWRKGVFYYKDVDDIHYMDNSIISDSMSLQGFLSNSHSQTDSEMELF